MGPKGIWIAVVCIGASGCVSLLPPIDRLAASEASIRDASAAGAARVAPASMYLSLADEEVAKARMLMEIGENDQADLQLLRAQADAELALNIARDNLVRNNAPREVASRGTAARAATEHADSNAEALPKTGKPLKEVP